MSGRVARTARVAAVTFAVAAGVLVVTAPPAAAHGVGGVQPRNYLTKLLRITPHVPGLELTVVDLGDNLLLHNRTGREVVVLGYQGEPYLRVGPQGVFENTRSPATYLNRTRIPTTNPPKFADAAAAPVWHKVSSGSTVKWHDHRVHYMGTEDPPQVQQDPSVRHLVDRWTVQLRAGGQTVTASGELVYVPPPSPWPFAAFAVTLAAALVLLSRTRWWRAALAVGLGALVASDLAHVVGVWNATTATTTSRLGESAYSLVGIGLGVLALVWMWKRGAESAMPLVLVASIFLFFAGGLADIATIGHSQIPTTFPPMVARLLVTANIGLGAGVAAGAALHLRRTVRSTAPARRRVPARVTS